MHTSRKIKWILLCTIFILIAVALGSTQNSRAGSTNNPLEVGNPQSHSLSGGHYLLTNHTQSSAQSVSNALQGGSYLLSQPKSTDDVTGCCCRNYIACIRKK